MNKISILTYKMYLVIERGGMMNISKIFIVILSYGILVISSTRPSTTLVGETMHENRKKIIIFDLDGVLFKENKPAFIKKVGFSDLAKYTLRTWSTPENICLDTLQCISTQEVKKHEIPLMHRGRSMPCCIMDWQLGDKDHIQVRQELAQHIDALAAKNHFKSEQDRDLTKRILDITLNPEHLADITTPISPMVQLAKQLKENGYKLLLLSNLATEHYDILHAKYPEIAKLFDGRIIISAHVKMLKPHKQIYQHVLDTYQLKAQECIFIDNQQENVDAALQCGIVGITHKNVNRTKIELVKFGIKI